MSYLSSHEFDQEYYFKSSNPHREPLDVYKLFPFYDTYFFNEVLQACDIRWSKRMTLCAGTCKHSAVGSCTITLSESLLQFCDVNQVKETLLHEMIHAFLFLTNPKACLEDGGHGKEFKDLMNFINEVTSLNITVYHSLHDEVDILRKHIWQCDGPCAKMPPYFGICKRAMNRPPQKSDSWWEAHQKNCGGTYVKVSGETQVKKTKQPLKRQSSKESDDDSTESSQRFSKNNRKQKKQPPPSTSFATNSKETDIKQPELSAFWKQSNVAAPLPAESQSFSAPPFSVPQTVSEVNPLKPPSRVIANEQSDKATHSKDVEMQIVHRRGRRSMVTEESAVTSTALSTNLVELSDMLRDMLKIEDVLIRTIKEHRGVDERIVSPNKVLLSSLEAETAVVFDFGNVKARAKLVDNDVSDSLSRNEYE